MSAMVDTVLLAHTRYKNAEKAFHAALQQKYPVGSSIPLLLHVGDAKRTLSISYVTVHKHFDFGSFQYSRKGVYSGFSDIATYEQVIDALAKLHDANNLSTVDDERLR